jgi:hypothetical protein
MKILILGLSVLSSVPFMNFAEACQLSIPESYVPTFLNPPVSGHYMKCEEKPEEKCFCVDEVDPYTSELLTEITQDELGINVETKVLKLSEVKKAEREATREAKRIAREAKIAAKESNKAELFSLKKSDIDNMTVSQRNAVIFKLLNIVQEIQE